MTQLDDQVRSGVFRHFLQTGRAPSADAVATELGSDASEVEGALKRLEARHALALAPTTTNVWMAHPFSAVPTPFRVDTEAVTYWGNCAWDAVAIPSLLPVDATVTAHCSDNGETAELRFDAGVLRPGSAPGWVVHFVVPPRRFWENVGYT